MFIISRSTLYHYKITSLTPCYTIFASLVHKDFCCKFIPLDSTIIQMKHMQKYVTDAYLAKVFQQCEPPPSSMQKNSVFLHQIHQIQDLQPQPATKSLHSAILYKKKMVKLLNNILYAPLVVKGLSQLSSCLPIIHQVMSPG